MNAPTRETTEHPAFDQDAIAQQLSSAVEAERAGREPGAVGAVMRRAVASARVDSMQFSDRGDRIAARLAKSMTVLVRALFEKAAPTSNSIAVCAVGGFGRGKLAPFSDIDLLFLHKPGDEAAIRPILDAVLYPMWDSGVKVGHGVHTAKTAMQLAKDDIVARTAYLEARFICGEKALFEKFDSEFRKFRRRTVAHFVTAKLKEQDARQEAAGSTRYLSEPNVKEGKGGLRDIQTIRWIYKYVFNGTIGKDSQAAQILGERNVRALIKAERFLWSVRTHLHDLRGRADEQLSFDIQPAVAERLGYADRKDMSAVERLMRHYFVTAVETGRLTRILCARLEDESAKRLPRLPALLPKTLQSDEAPGKPNIRMRGGRLDFDSAARARKTPRDFFRYFRAFSKSPKIDFHPDALALIADHVTDVTTDVRRDPVIAKLFRGILESNDRPVRTLRVMTETGLLGKYVPAYGDLVGRIQYGLYRQYTLDEELLRAMDVFREVRTGRLADEHPVSTRVAKTVANPYLITLALFFHETVWTVKGKSPAECEKLIIRIVKRLGLNGDDAAFVAWGAANHLMLVRTAERRNLTEARTIAQFAKAVGSQERLDLIVVLSTCHLRVVGRHAWDQVVRRQLIELYESASAWISGGEEALEHRLRQRAELARREAHTRLSGWSDAEKDAFLEQLTDDMLRCVDSDIIVRFAYLARAALEDRADAAVTVTPRDGDLECIVYADDRPGLLADIAGAVANAGLSVRSVQAMTTADGRAFDIFAVHSADDTPADDPSLARRIHEAMLAAAHATPKKKPDLKRRLGDRRQIFHVEPVVRMEADASQDAVVFETEALDRPGLLYDIASALGELGVSIASAHVATYGERAVDAFYLTNTGGGKITDKRQLKRIEKTLYAVLDAGAAA